MAIDRKYGKVTLEKGSIGENEPVFVFRAQDELLVPMLYFYRLLCKEAGSPEHHIDGIHKTIQWVQEWQMGNHTQTPRSE